MSPSKQFHCNICDKTLSTKPRLFRHKLMQVYAMLAKVTNTEFDDYNTNIEGHIFGEIVRYLTTKSFL